MRWFTDLSIKTASLAGRNGVLFLREQGPGAAWFPPLSAVNRPPPIAPSSPFIVNRLNIGERVVFLSSWGATVPPSQFQTAISLRPSPGRQGRKTQTFPGFLRFRAFLRFEDDRPGWQSQPPWLGSDPELSRANSPCSPVEAALMLTAVRVGVRPHDFLNA